MLYKQYIVEKIRVVKTQKYVKIIIPVCYLIKKYNNIIYINLIKNSLKRIISNEK